MKLLVGTRKGLFEIEKNGGRWEIGRISFLGGPVTALVPYGKSLVVGLNHGHFGVKVHRSDDHGATFAEIGVPKYDPVPEGADPKSGPSLVQVWSLERSADGSLLAGTIPGGLFRSKDEGATWELERPLWNLPERPKWMGSGGYEQPGMHSIVLDPRSPQRFGVAISTGGYWATEDGGATWEVRTKGMWSAYLPPDAEGHAFLQDVHRVVRCAGSPDVLWAQHHNAAFRSADDGRTWENLDVKPSVFGFAVGAHPTDPKTAWFVPAIKDEARIPVDGKLVVSRTTDGGKSYDVLSNGLPERAWDLVYRHGLDVGGDGKALAIGSTTGSLFVSEDGGDSWSCVSAFLPPIYVVRWWN